MRTHGIWKMDRNDTNVRKRFESHCQSDEVNDPCSIKRERTSQEKVGFKMKSLIIPGKIDLNSLSDICMYIHYSCYQSTSFDKCVYRVNIILNSFSVLKTNKKCVFLSWDGGRGH